MGPRAMHGKASVVGGRMVYANGGQSVSSEDGLTWTATPFQPEDVVLHAIASDDAGNIVGVDRTQAAFFHTRDGVNWEPAGVFEGPTTIVRIVAGWGEASEACPDEA